jgi:hypothetical protein
LHINFHEYVEMFNDVRNAKGLRRKLFYLFGDPIDIAEEKKRGYTVPAAPAAKTIALNPETEPEEEVVLTARAANES